LKFSKKTLILIVAGVFLIVAAVLAMRDFRQFDEKDKLTKQLAVSQARLHAIEIDELTARQTQLERQLRQVGPEIELVKAKFSQPVTSTAVATAIFEAADAFGLLVNRMASTSPADETVEGAKLSAITVTTEVEGNVSKVVDFIKALNNTFKTSAVSSVEIDATTGDNMTASVKLVVYMYREN
jgi:uncharacterized protein YqgV (UPF0045/DUF77 family)